MCFRGLVVASLLIYSSPLLLTYHKCYASSSAVLTARPRLGYWGFKEKFIGEIPIAFACIFIFLIVLAASFTFRPSKVLDKNR